MAAIRVLSLDKSTSHYNFNPFTHSGNNGVTYAGLSLGINQHGSFEVEIENTDNDLDTTNIKNGKRVQIWMGKTESTMNLMLSGLIRQTGFIRGCENNLLFSISGFGTGIRFNERILDVRETPSKLEKDGNTLDVTDTEFQANKIVDDTLDDTGFYPQNIGSETVEGTGGYNIINSSGTTVDSPIKDYIPGIFGRFVEISDIHDQVEGFTGGRVYADINDKLQLQPLMTPLSSNAGFLITTNPDFDNDLAANTCYVEGDYNWFNQTGKETGYSNGLYGILPADPVPPVDYFTDDTYYWENDDVEIAQLIRPNTNPNWRIYAAVEAVGMTNVEAENSVRGRWRLAEDDDGQPGEVIANRYMYPNQFNSTAEGGMQTIEIMGRGNTDLDENLNYWLILSSVNATPTVYWRWFIFRTGVSRGVSATAAAGTTSDTDASGSWTATPGYRQQFIMTRFKAEPYYIADQKGIDSLDGQPIESVIPGFPLQINNKPAAAKYMVSLMALSARPRRVFSFPSVTIPNNPIFPGDIAYIVDSRFNFSTAGNPIVTGQITDLQYSMGSKNAGLSTDSRGQTGLSLNVVGYNQFY